jgi:hypothetical protein
MKGRISDIQLEFEITLPGIVRVKSQLALTSDIPLG